MVTARGAHEGGLASFDSSVASQPRARLWAMRASEGSIAIGVTVVVHAIKLACLDLRMSHRPPTWKAVLFNPLLTMAWLVALYAITRRKRVAVLVYWLTHVVMYAVVLGCFANNDELVGLASLRALSGEAVEMPLSTILALGWLPWSTLLDAPLFALAASTAPTVGPRSRRAAGAAVIALVLLFAASGARDVRFGSRSDMPSLLRLHGVLACWLNEAILPESPAIPVPPAIAVAPTADARLRDVVMVQVESLDAAALLVDIDGQPLCPALRQFATRSTWCPFTLSHHYAGNSSDCDFAVLTSSEPCLERPTLKYVDAVRLRISLPRFLKRAGYSVTAWHDFEAGFFNRGNAYRSMGFDRFEDCASLGLYRGFGGDDGALLAKVAQDLARPRDPEARARFDYVITVTSHMPFRFAEHFDGLTEEPFPQVEGEYLRAYLRSIRYVDRCLGEFLATLSPDAIIVLFGDHPPGLPIQDSRDLQPPVFPGGRIIVDGALAEFVPMIIRIPGREPRVVRSVACYEDIAPTLAALIGGGRLRSVGQSLADADPTGVLPNRGGTVDRAAAFAAAVAQMTRHHDASAIRLRMPDPLEGQ